MPSGAGGQEKTGQRCRDGGRHATTGLQCHHFTINQEPPMDRRQFLAATCAGTIASPVLASSQSTIHATKATPPERNTWHVPIEAPCNRYARLLPVKKTLGMYLTIQSEEIRIVPEATKDLLGEYHASANSWTAVKDESMPATEEFRYESFRTRRYDRKTAEDLARNRSIVAAMTLMSVPWRTAENTLQIYGPVSRSITEETVEAIIRNTFGMVTRESDGFVWVMNPTTATDYAVKSPGGQVQYVPGILHDIPLVIEDAAWKGQYVIPDRDVLLLYRDDMAPYSGPSFSTLTLFMLEDGTAEHHRGKDNIVDDFDCKVTTPVSGVYLKSV